jgi:hypothetical protein
VADKTESKEVNEVPKEEQVTPNSPRSWLPPPKDTTK